MLVEQLIRDLKTMPQHAVVRARVYGSSKGRTIIHGPVEWGGAVELILDRDDRAKKVHCPIEAAADHEQMECFVSVAPGRLITIRGAKADIEAHLAFILAHRDEFPPRQWKRKSA